MTEPSGQKVVREMTPDDSGNREWRTLYREALLELDETSLKQWIAAAEAAIAGRMREIMDGPGSAEEMQAIQDALSSIRVLKRNGQ
jgi:hypothetical protein